MSSSDIDHVRVCLGAKYAIERELGRGGMGAVYLARDLRLDRPVALKVLPSTYAMDAALRERFLRETRTAASFSHPNIVPVHAIEESDDIVAFAMGYVEGEVLTERVRRGGPLGTRELVRLLQDIGYALAYAHGRGVVHRDIKPDNVMIERATGRALLMDFGISRTITKAPTGVAGLTRVGEVVGTPSYMSPEQASADALDGRSDIYSLGLVAYFAATGRTVMSGSTPQRILIRQLTEAVPPLAEERSELPKALTDAIDRCVAKEPAARFPSAEALVEAIDEAQLAAPEIPIPIRAFAQELSTLMLVIASLAVFTWITMRNAPADLNTLDRMLPVVFFFGIGLTRTLQSLSVVRRLVEAGFSTSDINRSLRATVDEQESVRALIKRSAESHKRRRRTIVVGLLQIPGAVALFYFAGKMRGPALNDPVPPGQKAIFAAPTFAGTAALYGGLLLIAGSLVLLSRSPFSMSPGERVFRWIWLGPIGRAFVAVGARTAGAAPRNGDTPRTGIVSPEESRAIVAPAALVAVAIPPIAVAPVAAAPVAGLRADAPSIASLDERVKALEQWRDERA